MSHSRIFFALELLLVLPLELLFHGIARNCGRPKPLDLSPKLSILFLKLLTRLDLHQELLLGRQGGVLMRLNFPVTAPLCVS